MQKSEPGVHEDELLGLLAQLLHVVDNGFLAPEVRTQQIKEVRERFLVLCAKYCPD